MEEKNTTFYASFFDKSTVLKVSHWAGVFAWVVLVIYLLTSTVSFIQFLTQFVSGVFYQKGMSVFDLLSFFTPYLLQAVPGVVSFFGLKFIQHTLLILMEMEESARRVARNGK